ncbi:MAG: hypothetical protein ACO3BX_04740 [Candidatus Limnocylindrus sp.]
MSSRHAKDRAEARRRGRIAARERAAVGDQPAVAETPADLAVKPSAPQPRAQTGIGFRAAFRGSFGRIPFKDDLRALPSILRTRAFFVPLIATLATVAISIQPGTINSNFTQLAVQTVLLPPAFVVAFMGGMLTRRGSWMLGGIFGVLTYAGSLVVGSAADLSGLAEGNPVAAFLNNNLANLNNIGALAGDLYGVAVSGIFAGAFAGWYGRFLRAMSPRPNARAQRRDAAERGKGGGRR